MGSLSRMDLSTLWWQTGLLRTSYRQFTFSLRALVQGSRRLRCCSICPSAYLPTYVRLGPIEGIPTYRHDYHLSKSRFVRRRKMGYRLEMVESNGKAGSFAPLSPPLSSITFTIYQKCAVFTDYSNS